MSFYPANVADILRSSQRDEEVVDTLQEQLAGVLKFMFGRDYNLYKKAVPHFSKFIYYYLTSCSNLQTLGEEYAGILRVTQNNVIANKMVQYTWLILFIYGEPFLDRALQHLRKTIKSSESLTDNAKTSIISWINFVTENKHIFIRIHHSLFYMDNLFYNVSNRMSGIKYVLVRQWLQDDSSTKSFQILGKLSLFYLLLYLVQMYFGRSKTSSSTEVENVKVSGKSCVLCVENCKNPSATPCGHLFCWDCIYDSLKYNPRCPVCREHVHPSRIVLLQNYA